MLRRKIFIIIIIFCLSLFLTNDSYASNGSLYISPSSGEHETGNTFSIDIKVNTGGTAINAGEGSLVFLSDKLEVVSISKSGSIFTLWTTEPAFSNSSETINFGGGIPNPGYSGASGKIITITFKAKTAGTVKINFSSGSILANDGKGTNILSSLGSANYTIKDKVQKTKTTEKKPAQKETTTDTESIVEKPQIISLTHPDQNIWYNNNNVKLKWELPYGIKDLSILLNEKLESNPGPISDGLFSSKEYDNIQDGISYLHLKFKDKQNWSEIEHFKIQIDTKPPEQFKINVTSEKYSGWPILNFKTKDKISGIDRYEIKINNKDFIATPDNPILPAPVLDPGKYTAIVKAIDKAENETLAVVDFIIKTIEAPIIKNYQNELKPNDLLFISGTALVDVSVNIFIQNEKTGQIIKQEVQSDENGNWYYVYKNKLVNGKYSVWTQAINAQGMKSSVSNKINFLITPPIFVIFGTLIINYFAVFIILLLFIILIIAFFAYWTGLMKNKLRKEVNEAQIIIHKNLKELKKLIEKETKGKQTVKTRKILKNRTNFIEKKVDKEIQDIKDLLKLI